MENMTSTENKYMILARIALLLRRKGLHVSISTQSTDNEYISFFVHSFDGNMPSIVEDLDARETTEAELIEWWSAIEG